MRVYISGPMTGLPELNFPAFHAVAALLRYYGHEVVNPAEIEQAKLPDDASEIDREEHYYGCLREDIKQLVTCNTVCLLEGWQDSSGAHLEVSLAHRLGMRVMYLHQLCAHVLPAEAAA